MYSNRAHLEMRVFKAYVASLAYIGMVLVPSQDSELMCYTHVKILELLFSVTSGPYPTAN